MSVARHELALGQALGAGKSGKGFAMRLAKFQVEFTWINRTDSIWVSPQLGQAACKKT
ncbi:MAG: hypothetical protein OXS32_09760 [Verrucomicrobiales bacterium]|nr:hypothetical protein [Verrucomicrobiales bacterium]